MTLMCDVFRDILEDMWPLRSPDVTSPDFYLWGEMKGAVYKDNHYTFLELKDAIADFFRNIPPTELSRVFANKTRHVDACLQHVGVIYSICCNISMRNISVWGRAIAQAVSRRFPPLRSGVRNRT
jgi:hypothetical protein